MADVATNSNGNVVATSDVNSLRIWRDGKQIGKALGGDDGLRTRLSMDEAGSILACSISYGIAAWEIESGKRLFYQHLPNGAQSLCISPDGKFLAYSTTPVTDEAETLLEVVEIASGKLVKQFLYEK